MSADTHVARVTATFEFVGVVSNEFAASDPVKRVEAAFKFFNADVPGFVCERRILSVRTAPVTLPEIPASPATEPMFSPEVMRGGKNE